MQVIKGLTRITYILLSVKHGKVPLTWKTARVIPVYKAGDKTKPDEYRPISTNNIKTTHQMSAEDQLPSTLVIGQSLDGGAFMWFLIQI